VKNEMAQNFLVELPNIKLNHNQLVLELFHAYGQTDGLRLMGAAQRAVSAPKNKTISMIYVKSLQEII
jgi:hypothetical protein